MKQLLYMTSGIVLAVSGSMAFAQNYTQTNLVSNRSGKAPVTDPQLVNSWGIARTSSGDWWVSDKVTGVATLYDGSGQKQTLVVTIPGASIENGAATKGSPTGVISNASPTDFLLAPGKPAEFIFATLDGTIAAWNPEVALARGQAAPSTHAVTVAKGAKDSGYTGLTAAFIDNQRYLYAANFKEGRVDVFNNAFHPVTLKKENFDSNALNPEAGPFQDDFISQDFAPFNVQTVGNDIVVTYAFRGEGQQLEVDGPGLGFVDLYNSKGELLVRFEHGDWLNAPWGVALSPLDFGRFSHHLLVGQFAGGGTTESSGLIAAYDLTTGKFDGVLQDAAGQPLVINGIWSLSPGNVSPKNYDPAGSPAAELYFSAGPNNATEGLFGYLTPVTTQLIEGNNQ
jgi:uncharacterized protein (TIGR03118 family)